MNPRLAPYIEGNGDYLALWDFGERDAADGRIDGYAPMNTDTYSLFPHLDQDRDGRCSIVEFAVGNDCEDLGRRLEDILKKGWVKTHNLEFTAAGLDNPDNPYDALLWCALFLPPSEADFSTPTLTEYTLWVGFMESLGINKTDLFRAMLATPSLASEWREIISHTPQHTDFERRLAQLSDALAPFLPQREYRTVFAVAKLWNGDIQESDIPALAAFAKHYRRFGIDDEMADLFIRHETLGLGKLMALVRDLSRHQIDVSAFFREELQHILSYEDESDDDEKTEDEKAMQARIFGADIRVFIATLSAIGHFPLRPEQLVAELRMARAAVPSADTTHLFRKTFGSRYSLAELERYLGKGRLTEFMLFMEHSLPDADFTQPSTRRKALALCARLRAAGSDYYAGFSLDLAERYLDQVPQNQIALLVLPDARTDWNGAFFSTAHPAVSDLLDMGASQNVQLHIIQARQGDKALLKYAKSRAPDSTQIVLLHAAGHGTPKTMQWGMGGKEGAMLDVNDRTDLTRFLRPLIAPNAWIIADSCETGKEGPNDAGNLLSALYLGLKPDDAEICVQAPTTPAGGHYEQDQDGRWSFTQDSVAYKGDPALCKR